MSNLEKFDQAVQLLKQEKYPESLAILNQLIDSEPKNADFYSERGVVFFHLKRMKESMSDMNRAVQLEPNKSYRYSSRAYIKGHNRLTKEAIEDYQKAIELDPEDAIAHNNLGLLEEQLGYEKKSKKRFELADRLSEEQGIGGRSDQGLSGKEIKARNIQKEIEEDSKNTDLWSIIKSLGTSKGRTSLLRFIKSGFKQT